MEEGSPCPACKEGVFETTLQEPCTCHLGHPPCGACVNAPLVCNGCGEHANDLDLCGLCGEPGADKMSLLRHGGVAWPGERIPDGLLVHSDCERAETERAFLACPQTVRDAVLKGARRG